MAKSTKEHLEDTFNDLGTDDLKSFKNKLCDRKKGAGIRKAQLQKVADAIDLADLMVRTFTSTGAVPVAIEILEAIGCNEPAAELKENAGHGLPVAQSRGDVVDHGASQGLKVELALSDDWHEQLHVVLCSQQFKNQIIRENGQEIYEVKEKYVRKRLALLINNIDFDDKAMTRRGADRDEQNMEWLLKELDYQVVKYRNLSAKDMEKAVMDFARREEHAHSDSTFVVIMSHGKRDAILGVHYTASNPSDTFPVDNVYRCLNTEKCPGLRDKPKVILLQACRGGDSGRLWASDGEPDEPVEIEGDDFVHKEKDFISLMSCTPDTKSYRHVENGTFYVQNVVDVLMKHAHKDHIEELFRKVIQRFESTEMMGSYKQMACKDRASLPKLFYLFPGLWIIRTAGKEMQVPPVFLQRTMAKSNKDHLQDIFDDLGAEDQRKFKSKLCDRKTEPRVRRAAVEKVVDSIDLANLMVTAFTTTGAVPVTIEILQAIGCNEPAQDLIKNTGQSGPSAPSTAAPHVPSPAPGPSASSTEHFIDRNRATLIKRVHNVDGILDELLQMRVITDEDYSNIRAEKTSTIKMRELLMGPIKSAGTRGKDGLYKALKFIEPCLTEELEHQ
ncbi:caspase-1-like [Sinocyclocheilus rhinocerous]|nr:PREDICTED: caspase-1-like [Sinocyclocheilus rhinocerous]